MLNHDLEEIDMKLKRRLKVYIVLLEDIKYKKKKKMEPHEMFLKDILIIFTEWFENRERQRSTIKHNCQKIDREK